MLHTCTARFNVTMNFEKFCQLDKALDSPRLATFPCIARTSGWDQWHTKKIGIGSAACSAGALYLVQSNLPKPAAHTVQATQNTCRSARGRTRRCPQLAYKYEQRATLN